MNEQGETPERIWLNPHSAVVCDHSLSPKPYDVEYVRADLLTDIVDVVKLVAHPKFTTDNQGHIHYYVTKSDVRFARALLTRIEAAAQKKAS